MRTKIIIFATLLLLMVTIQGCGTQAKEVLQNEPSIELTEQNVKEAIDSSSIDKFKNHSVILKGYLSADIVKNPNNGQYQGQVVIGEQEVLISSEKDITELKKYDLVEVTGKVDKIVPVKLPSDKELKFLRVEVENIKKAGVLPESERTIDKIINPQIDIKAPTGISINVNRVELLGKNPYTCAIYYDVTNQTNKTLQNYELWVTARGYYQGKQVIVIQKTSLILNSLDMGTYGKNIISGNINDNEIDKLVLEVGSTPY